jgi:hypothetical protein
MEATTILTRGGLSKEQLDRRAQALRDSLVPKVRGKPRDDERTR